MTVRECTGEPAPRVFVNSAPVGTNFNEFVHSSVTEALDIMYIDNENSLYRFTVNAEFGVDDNDHQIFISAWEDR